MTVFTTASNGAINCRGEPADKTKTGGWKAAPFIIVNEVAERMAFFSIVVSLKMYLTTQMNMVLSEAATTTTDWVGASHFLTIFGAFLADAYLGRYRTMVVFSTVYAIGMALLTFTASDPSLRPPPGQPSTLGQHALLLLALAIIAFGTGGIKPCVSTFGADQFDDADEREARKKYSFFNWFFLAINFGAVLGIVSSGLMVKRFGWVGGFGVPAVMSFVSLAVFVAGNRLYRYQRPTGSPLTRFMQVLVAACRNHKRGVVLKKGSGGEGGVDPALLYEVRTAESDIVGARKLQHTDEYSFLDKAAVQVGAGGGVDASSSRSRWRLCSVTQVEELKAIVRLFPIFLTTIALSVSFSQLSTFFISQSAVMDRRIKRMSNYEMRPGSTLLFGTLSPVLIVPIYAKIIIPLLRGFTGHPRGITSLQRMGAGLFVSVVAMAVAAVVERKRLHSPDPALVTVFWLFPQTFLMGAAEVFTYVGQLEFFYDQATDGTRSICSALVMVESGFGHWISTILVKIVTSKQLGWIRHDLNHSRLDLFYWLLAGINLLNLIAYIVAARSYKGRINDVDSQLAAEVAANDHVAKWDVEEDSQGSSRRILAAAN